MNFNTHQSHHYLPLPPIFVLQWGYYSWVMSESRTFPLWKQRLMGHWLLLQDAILFYLFLGPRFTRWRHSEQNHSMGEQLTCLGKQAVVINWYPGFPAWLCWDWWWSGTYSSWPISSVWSLCCVVTINVTRKILLSIIHNFIRKQFKNLH